MKVGNKEKCCEKDCKTPQEYMDNHFPLHVVDIVVKDEKEKEDD